MSTGVNSLSAFTISNELQQFRSIYTHYMRNIMVRKLCATLLLPWIGRGSFVTRLVTATRLPRLVVFGHPWSYQAVPAAPALGRQGVFRDSLRHGHTPPASRGLRNRIAAIAPIASMVSLC